MTKEQKIIIIVDDNDSNLTACKKILKPYYVVYPAPSAAKMFDLLEHNIMPDLILLDVEMPDTNGYDAARLLKNIEAYKKIPIMFLTARNDAISEMEGLNLGALDYIHKPFVSALLLKRIDMHLSLVDYQKKSEFFSRVSQEIRTSLSEIADLLNLAMNSEDSNKTAGILGKASGVSKQLLALVNDTPSMS